MLGLPFETTHWSVILAAAGKDPSEARAALSTLCETYWYPLYAYVRRRGADADSARDLTQGFLASLLERRSFANLDRSRGRFRAFLLASLQHFLANDAARQGARKRGGGVAFVPFEFETAESRYRFEPADRVTPEVLYKRRWALTVIERVMARLRSEAVTAGRAREFDELKACLLGTSPPGGYAAIAARLGTSEGAVRVAVHRLRRQFQRTLRHDIAETVASEQEVEEEIRYLIRALEF